MLGHLVETGRVRVQQGRHLVDERAGAACARTVHPLFRSRLEVGDFRVLAAELDDDIRLRDLLVDRAGFGDDLLDEGHVQVVGEGQAAGTGDCQANRLVAAAKPFELLVDVFKQSGDCGPHVGMMATVIGEQHAVERVILIQYDRFDCGRSDVKTDTQRLLSVFAGHDMLSLLRHLHLISIVGRNRAAWRSIANLRTCPAEFPLVNANAYARQHNSPEAKRYRYTKPARFAASQRPPTVYNPSDNGVRRMRRAVLLS